MILLLETLAFSTGCVLTGLIGLHYGKKIGRREAEDDLALRLEGRIGIVLPIKAQLRDFIAKVARKHDMDTGTYILQRALGAGDMIDTSPLVPAPPPAKT